MPGLLGMATKFTECTLGVKYRNEFADGHVSGGPMYYLSKGLAARGFAVPGRIMAGTFAVFCVLGSFGAGNMFQANQVHAQLVNVTGGDASFLAGQGWITGLVLAVVVFAVIVGGIKSIATFAEFIVPIMAIIYCGAALIIIGMNIEKLPWAIGQIVSGAFTGAGVAGGMLGAIIQGFRRASFSNEAGLGSAAIAHSAVRTKHPVTEGLVSLLEPFIDTIVICTCTALVIVMTGVLQIDPATGLYVWNAEAGRIATQGNLTGVELTSAAFESAFSWFPYVLAVAVDPVCFLDADFVVLLRRQGVDVSLRRGTRSRDHLQYDLLQHGRRRRGDQLEPCHRLRRRGHLFHGPHQHRRPLHPDA